MKSKAGLKMNIYGAIKAATPSFIAVKPNGGAKGSAMGNTFLGLAEISGIFGNPANLTSISQWEAQGYAQNRFLLPELKEMGIGFYAWLWEELQESGCGNPALADTKSNWPRFVTPGFSGLVLAWASYLMPAPSIPEYGNVLAVNGSFGLHAELLPGLIAAVLVDHPFRQSGILAEFMPAQLGAGIRYEASEKTRILIELIKGVDHPASFRAGLDYQLLPILSFQNDRYCPFAVFHRGRAPSVSAIPFGHRFVLPPMAGVYPGYRPDVFQ